MWETWTIWCCCCFSFFLFLISFAVSFFRVCCKVSRAGVGMRTAAAAATCCTLFLAAVGPATAAQRASVAAPNAFNYRGSKPNIIIVYADDLGSGDLGFYGHPTSSTPNLNTFIMEGTRMTQYYSPAAICSPSRGSLVSLLLATLRCITEAVDMLLDHIGIVPADDRAAFPPPRNLSRGVFPVVQRWSSYH